MSATEQINIHLQSVPPTPDPRLIVAWIRACIWADVEGRPFCRLR